MELRGTAPLSPETAQRYLYNGKEQVEGTGLYAYGFRYYDPATARFTGVDPIADQFAFVSGFNYAENRPIDGIDLHGLQYLNFNNVNKLSHDMQMQHYFGGGLNYPVVQYNGESYYNVGSDFTSSPFAQFTEWVYTNISNYNSATDHVYVWEDPTLAGNNVFGKPRNENCADLACAQANELGTSLENGVVSYNSIIEVYNAENGTIVDSDGALNYLHTQLEAGNVVVVGVDYGASGGTDSRGTDHYVTVVGRSSQNGVGHFYFIDNALGSLQGATDFTRNRITPGTGNSNLGGTTRWHNNTYETTRVQRNQ